ncbi:hypothetical protein [Rhizobium sp. BK176]|uniref:hypothetical protein n=1 Tax=Rhizobium sp. BK176 TaxID=2587071 RepID=UPI002168CA83|nr:hypothetical protein [Rhizobium sp. BK176]MCS4088481.1 hypothetical protein [Rhizobium sp. BK176]
MRDDYNKSVANHKTTGVASFLGSILRKIPGNRVVTLVPADEPMVKMTSGLNEACVPLSLVKMIVRKAPSNVFYRSTVGVHMSGGALANILEDFECGDMPLSTRYAVVEALRVAHAAAVFTFEGDVDFEADKDTIDLAFERGGENDFAYTDACHENAKLAAARNA